MIRRFIWIAALLLVTSSCSSDAKDETPDSNTQDVAQQDVPGDVQEDTTPWVKGCVDGFCAADPDHAPDPSKMGPFPVGVETFYFYVKGDSNETRKIVTEVWYPATEEVRDLPYDNVNLMDGAPQELIDKIGMTAIDPIPAMQHRDAPLRKADGPYPLILFSHGAFGIRFQNVYYTTLLASHGYIVASPDHQDNTLYDILLNGYDMDKVVESAFDRPLDVYGLLDKMLERNEAKDDRFHDAIDADNIGITGHSFGGFTSILCPYEDDRIKASVPMTPSTYAVPLLGHEFKDFPIPILMMTGTQDRTLETDVEMAPAYEQMPAPKSYFELYKAGHYSYTDICSLDLLKLAEELDFGDAEDALSDGCGEDNISVDIAHPLINQFAVGFFNYHLKGSTDSKKYFDAAAAEPHSDILLYKIEE